MLYGYMVENKSLITEANKLPGGATTDEEISNQSIVKKAESKIKSTLNKALKEFFEADKDSKVDDDLKDYNWRTKLSSAPTVWKFDYTSCNIPAVYLDYSKSKSIDHDSILFFEEDFVKWFKKSKNDLNKFFYLSVEDYPGIFIEPKKTIKESSLTESIEFNGKVTSQIEKLVRSVFNKNKDSMYEDAKSRYDDIKKSDIKLSQIDARERNIIRFMVDIGEYDGFYDCMINLKYKESDLGYFSYSFND